jgi:putative phosphoesterase
MRLCVLSDTHIPDRYEELPAVLTREIQDADMVIHAGDFTSVDCYEHIRSLNPNIKAVLGNIDAFELASRLKEKEVFTVEKFKIGLMHGFGKPESILDNVKKTFRDTCDLVIYGHAHEPFCEKIGKTLYFNPGSPTDKIFSTYNAYGIITIDTKIDAKIIRIPS